MRTNLTEIGVNLLIDAAEISFTVMAVLIAVPCFTVVWVADVVSNTIHKIKK